MDCYSFDRIISDYIDANLNVKQRQEANEHIDACPECRKKLLGMKGILSELHSLTPCRTRPDFESRLMDRIARGKEQKENRVVRMFQDYARPLSVVAAVMLLVAASIFVYTSVVVPQAPEGIPAAEIRTAEPSSGIRQTVNAATVQPAMANTNNEANLPDSNNVEKPNYNNQIMMVNE